MKRRFKITLEGETREVDVEEVVEGRVGDTVKAGGVLIIPEAMKMESDICSPKDGEIKEIHVSEGGYVKKGEPMVSIEG